MSRAPTLALGQLHSPEKLSGVVIQTIKTVFVSRSHALPGNTSLHGRRCCVKDYRMATEIQILRIVGMRLVEP